MSINELLEEPIGAAPIQLALPIVIQVKPGRLRRGPYPGQPAATVAASNPIESQ
jgi:hypothetical protein